MCLLVHYKSQQQRPHMVQHENYIISNVPADEWCKYKMFLKQQLL